MFQNTPFTVKLKGKSSESEESCSEETKESESQAADLARIEELEAQVAADQRSIRDLESRLATQERQIAQLTEDVASNQQTPQQMFDTAFLNVVDTAEVSDCVDKKLNALLALANIRTQNKKGQTALHLSTLHNNVKLSAILLDNESGLLTIKDQAGDTPIQQAARAGNIKMLDWLYEQGKACNLINTQEAFNQFFEVATLEAKQFLANKQLLESAKTGDSERIIDALNKGADINVKDPRGNTALHQAVSGDYADIVQLLITKNADPTIHDDYEQLPNAFETPLDYAVTQQKYNLIQIMITSFLIFAAHHGSKKDVLNALDLGADLKGVDQQGETALHKAIHNNNVEIIKILLNQYAKQTLSINTKINETPSPFELALKLNHTVTKSDEEIPLALYLGQKIGTYKNALKNQTLFKSVKSGNQNIEDLAKTNPVPRYSVL